MKKYYLLLCTLCACFVASATSLHTEILSRQKVSDLSNNLIAPEKIKFVAQDDNLLVTIYRVMTNPVEVNEEQNPLIENITADVVDDVLIIRHFPDINLEVAPEEYSNAIIGNISVCIDGVSEKYSAIKYFYNDGFIMFGGVRDVELPLSFYYVGQVEPGKTVVIDSSDTPSKFVDSKKEWVIYNPADTQGNPRYFRIRFHGYDTDIDELYGIVTSYHHLWVYEGTEFNEQTATKIGSMAAYDGADLYLTNASLPSAFWGTGFKSNSFSPAEWFSSGDVKTYCPFVWNSDADDTFDYYGMPYTMKFKGKILSEKPEMLDGRLQVRYVVADSEYSDQYPDDWKAEWLRGIGPVGDTYASNPIAPLYELPDGVKPAYLLYVRDITTNEVLYGDTSLDPEFFNLKAEPAGVENVADAQPDTYTVYTASGICILKDGTHTQYDNLPKGLYIVNGKKILKK